jgi:hypothetical protein
MSMLFDLRFFVIWCYLHDMDRKINSCCGYSTLPSLKHINLFWLGNLVHVHTAVCPYVTEHQEFSLISVLIFLTYVGLHSFQGMG